MGAVYHKELYQGSEEWRAARCGMLTASEMKFILTPTLKIASNDKERAHLYELLSQRITQYVEPSYIGDDMLRGMDDEIEARRLYGEHHAWVTECGFVTNDKWGFTLGYSPDGLVNTKGLIEAKSRKGKFQIETIISGNVPEEHVLQCQTGLLVADDREWLDFVSYSGGLPMVTIRVWPDPKTQNAILEAAANFEVRIEKRLAEYRERLAGDRTLIPTKRRIINEMHL